MAQQDVNISIKAKDEASAAIQRVTREFVGLKGAVDSVAAIKGVLAFAGIGAAAGAAALGVYKLVEGLSQAVESMGLVRGTTGATIAQIQVMRRAFENTGLGAERADTMMAYMARSIGMGNAALKNMGIDTRDVYEALLQFSDKLADVKDAGNRANIMQAVLGKSWKDGARALDNLRGNVAGITAIYARFGSLLTDEVAGGAEALDAKLDEVNTTLDAMKTALALKLVPATMAAVMELEAMFKILTAIASIPGITEILGFVAAALNSIRPTVVVKTMSEDFKELAGHLKAIAIYFAEGEAAARRFMAASGVQAPLGAFGGFGGGASRGKGGGAGWTDDKSKGSKTYETGMVQIGLDEDQNPLFGYKTKGDKTDDSRKKRLEDIAQTMRTSTETAKVYLGILEQVESKAKANKMADDIFSGITGSSIADVLKGSENDIGLRNPMGPAFNPQMQADKPNLELEKQLAAKQREIIDAFPEMSSSMIEMGIQWGATVESVLGTTAVLDQSFGALWNGLQNGFGQVFANLTNKAQTFKGAMKTIFQALVQEILAMLARMAAAKVFQFVVGVISGHPEIALAPNPGLGGLPLPDVRTGGAQPGSVTININALSAGDIARSMLSPRGEFRQAQAAVLLGGAY